ncbi:hypothetical protein [Bacillus thuringiensis]
MIDHPIEAALGNGILLGDRLVIKSDGEVGLKDKNMDYVAWI